MINGSLGLATEPARRDETVRRKVTASGVIWLDGRAYYVSRRLAGRVLPVTVAGDKLVVDASIPIRKEYALPSVASTRRARRNGHHRDVAGPGRERRAV
jgi:hypothetical protein